MFKSFVNMPRKAVFKAEGNVLTIDGEIGSWWDELDSKNVSDTINGIEGDITVKLNSPGGSVFDGIAIMNELKAHNGKVTVIVEGLAASIASVIAIGAADELHMMEGSMLMIHNAWAGAAGNAEELRKLADTLDEMSENLAGIYASHSNKSIDEIKKAMDEETWFTAKKAKDFGFNVVIEEGDAKLKNFAMLSAYNHVPEVYKNSLPASSLLNKRDLEADLHSLGYSRSEAKRIASKALFDSQRDADGLDSEKLLKLENAISERKQIFKKES